jgi:hypothetical protein
MERPLYRDGDNGMSVGAERVREDANPSKYDNVDKIKRWTADCIDFCEEHKHHDPRLASLAQTYFEIAAMWAVKLVTTKK